MTELEFRAWGQVAKRNWKWVLYFMPLSRAHLFASIARSRCNTMQNELRAAGFRGLADELEEEGRQQEHML